MLQPMSVQPLLLLQLWWKRCFRHTAGIHLCKRYDE
jgi:hypothetical protein